MKIKHHFFGKECEIDRELLDYSGVESCLKSLKWGFKAINFVSQVHGNEIILIDDESKILPKQGLPKADAIVCNLSKVAIAVVTADCSPIILKDEKSGVVAVVHAGWRGAKLNIVNNAVNKMLITGAKIEQIQAFIGPMIYQKSYQVSKEFYDDFVGFEHFFIKDKEKDKFLFDLVGFVRQKLKNAGIEKIDEFGIDTYENYEKFATYRKACHLGLRSGGRNISIAMIE